MWLWVSYYKSNCSGDLEGLEHIKLAALWDCSDGGKESSRDKENKYNSSRWHHGSQTGCSWFSRSSYAPDYPSASSYRNYLLSTSRIPNNARIPHILID